MYIREANDGDMDGIWPIFHSVIASGDTYAIEPDVTKAEAFTLWMQVPRKTYVCEDAGTILGTYYIKTNQQGPGSHVCNCAYMVAAHARGQGLATSMCEHSQIVARRLGYKAMQFNFVACTNEGAVRLWQRLGYDSVGRLPKAFNHPQQGYTDALIMYKCL